MQAMARVMERLRHDAEGRRPGAVVGPLPPLRRAVRQRRARPRRRRPRPRRVVRGRRAAALHAHGPRHRGGAGARMRLRYEEHTWPELRELAKRDDLVVVIPTATLEDHGYHLPIDTDARLVERDLRARGRGERRPGAAVPDPGPRLHAAPPRLPRQRHAALERVRRVAARPGPLALPPRLRPHPDRQRPRLQPAAGRHRGAADQPRAPQRGLRLVLLPPEPSAASR